jgi:predicted glycoside hydrolase/deacetylase ChbG (UPF0249 family)
MTGRRLVIFNADDFGLTDSVCRGINEAVGGGVVRATTAMVCTSGSRENIARWASSLAGLIGVHLQLTEGRACLDPTHVPSIVDANGDFPNSPAGVLNVNPVHVRARWSLKSSG